MATESTLTSHFFRTTRVQYRTTWAMAHSENFCVRVVAFVNLILLQCEAFPPFLFSFSRCDSWAERTSAITGSVSLDNFD